MALPAGVASATDVDLRDPRVVCEVFERAAKLNVEDPKRRGGVIEMPSQGRLLMTGDLHDHGLNFHRLLKLAGLDRKRTNFLVLHEVIHGPARINGRDLSIRTLARVAALKCQYPEQVLTLQSNHELAQMIGEGIVKDGANSVEAFDAGVEMLFGDDAPAVREAMNRFIRSHPLAIRCPRGVFCSHSLPAPRKIDVFDPSVLDRACTDDDLKVGGSAYLMVWGRHHNQRVADELAAAWKANVFVMGHQPAEMGYEEEGQTMLILASDHDHGVALPIDLSREYTRDDLINELVPLASVVL